MKIRCGLLIGIIAVLFPPAAISLDQVGKQVLSATRGMDSIQVHKETERIQTDGDSFDQLKRHSDTSSPVSNAIRDQISGALTKQGAALLKGDLPGFLDAVDPADKLLRDDLSKRFGSLKAMKVAQWSESIVGRLTMDAEGSIVAPVQVKYCFVLADCAPVAVTIETKWSKTSGSIRLTVFGTTSSQQAGPRPWEVSELQSLIGKRVVVATTKKWASRLSSVLSSAERAASIADRYAQWSSVPGRYFVYIAGTDEWGKWYGANQASWVAAYAMPLAGTYTEIVLNVTKVGSTDVREILQHEFAHVVTLWGVRSTHPNVWWLVEGIAEYIQNLGQPISVYRALMDGKRYVRSGWNGSVALGQPPPTATTSDANGQYAVAYLTLRRLAEAFGEPRMLEFFNMVVRQGKSVDAASASVFKRSWQQTSDDCARYVRRSVGVY